MVFDYFIFIAPLSNTLVSQILFLQINIIGFSDILTGEICRHFRLLILTSCIGKFIHPVEGRGWMWGIVILASYKYHFIRVQKNFLVTSKY